MHSSTFKVCESGGCATRKGKGQVFPVVVMSCAVSSDVGLIEVELISEYLDGANKSCGNSEARIEQGVLGSLDPADYRESRIT